LTVYLITLILRRLQFTC